MVPRVAVVRWGSEPSAGEVKIMVSRCLELVGGLNSLVEKGETVALKPNVVTGELSGPGVTTDKNVVGSLVELLYEAGAGEVLIVEGAGYFTETSKALELSGFKELAERLGAGLVDVDSSPTVEVEVFLAGGGYGRAAVPSGASDQARCGFLVEINFWVFYPCCS